MGDSIERLLEVKKDSTYFCTIFKELKPFMSSMQESRDGGLPWLKPPLAIGQRVVS